MNYSFSRKTFLFTYNATFKKLISKNDLVFDIYSRGPQNLSNFFGTGNNSVFVNEGDKKISYYRCRYDYINTSVQLSRPLAPHWQLYGGVAGQFYYSKQANNTGRFLDSYNTQFPDEKVYEDKTYAGITAGVSFNTRNDLQLPSHGIHWNTIVKSMKQLGGDGASYSQLLSEFTFYTTLFNSAGFVLANRTGFSTTVGDPAFFQLNYLGGPQTMRGFHTNRFAGKTALVNNLEFRVKLFDFNSYLLPGSVGLIAFNDFGRVWMPGESSNQWHDSYGTGLYIVPAQLVLIQGVMGFSKEGNLFYIAVGFRF